MKKLAPVIVGVVIVAALSLAVLAGGCGSDGDAAGSVQDEVCPDTLVEVDSIVLISSAGGPGQLPEGVAVFPTDTPEILGVVTLSQDMCCTQVTVTWRLGEETVYHWSGEDPADIGDSFTVPFVRPEGGFTTGQYKVSVYIGIRELVNASFTVE